MKSMKKMMFFCTILFLLLFLWKAKGVEITSGSITGPREVVQGENITVNVKANIAGMIPQIDSPIEVNAVVITFSFDENVFIPTSVSADGFTSSIYQTQDGNYLIISEANNQNNCGIGQLFCGNYNANLTFYTKETTTDTSSFQFNMIAVQYIDIETYDTEDDAMEEIKEMNQSHSVTIKKKGSNITSS